MYLKILIALLLSISVIGVFAEESELGKITAGGYELFRIKYGSMDLDVQQRTVIIQERMVDLLSSYSNLPIKVSYDSLPDGSIMIYAGSKKLPIIRVQNKDAELENTTVDKLAKTWGNIISNIYPKARPIVNFKEVNNKEITL